MRPVLSSQDTHLLKGTYCIAFLFNVMSLPKVALVGHSFIRRLNHDIQSKDKFGLHRNFNLSQCWIKFRWSGGWEVLDKDRFDSVFVPFLKDFRPHVVVLQVGGNDVNNTDTMVQSISIASEMEELAIKLIYEYCVKLVFICDIFYEKTT